MPSRSGAFCMSARVREPSLVSVIWPQDSSPVRSTTSRISPRLYEALELSKRCGGRLREGVAREDSQRTPRTTAELAVRSVPLMTAIPVVSTCEMGGRDSSGGREANLPLGRRGREGFTDNGPLGSKADNHRSRHR